ncbi:hypothetical protein DID88_000096 [Monilinia fructigena]|uniref:HIT domain-containing protein n=1 Tax=Monilinia fructigena TaxID=38457 RepID=A0A395IJ96_9HELO|nr:hypothetical protein DID88_000096 [Monilinia fructigena]
MSSSTPSDKLMHFGKFEVTDQVFHKSTHCYCLVNIKPILPGHVLVIPYKQHPRMTDLSPPELSDIFLTTQKVQKMLASHYFPKEDIKEGSFNVAIQDGPESGQTVDDEDRLPRSTEEMNQEAALFRKQMRKLGYTEREFVEKLKPLN